MVYAFTNQKGGVGKTTSAINLGSSLALQNYSVLLVDFDSQANLTSGVGHVQHTPTIYDVMSQNTTIQKSIQPTYQENLYVIPSSADLSGAAIELATQENREFFLKNSLQRITHEYDFIFIDCPPSFGLLTVNALCASDAIIIPLQCEYFAMEGIAQLINNIQHLQKNLTPTLFIFGIILTMYDKRTILSKEVAKEIVSAFGGYVFQTIIQRNIKIAEAPSFGKSVLSYDRNSVGAQSYYQLSEEVIARWKNQ